MKLIGCFIAFVSILLSMQAIAVEVIKNRFDEREFEFVELENGLQLLLISNEKLIKSAVALDVYVGSGDDPKDMAGLAHFLEHMLFLGTEKYPVAGEFYDFINGHGGSHNAYTSVAHTNYFFDIDSNFLPDAIDRFSQFFIAPTFDVNYVERELNAVHSEFSSKIHAASRRENDVVRELVHPDHPLSRFSTGNLQTLGVIDSAVLRRELIAFYKRHYSAHRMRVAITGPQSLAQLKQQSVAAFSQIKRNKSPVKASKPALFHEDFLPAEVHIIPKKEQRKLSLVFPIPNTSEYIKEKPLYYISNLIGHEGKGSLLSLFKELEWATALSAGGGWYWRDGQTYAINIQLTPLGATKIPMIYRLVFAYIDMLEQQGIDRWRYDELASISHLSFEYSEQGAAIDEVSGLARALQEVGPERIYWNAYSLERYDQRLIRRYVGLLAKENALTLYTGPQVSADKISQYYQTPYRVIDKEKSIRQAGIDDKRLRLLTERLALPSKNPFVAKKHTIVEPSQSSSIKDQKPVLVYDRNATKGWFLNDNFYDVPKGQVSAQYTLPFVAESVENYAVLSLYLAMLNEELNEKKYTASIAGLSSRLAMKPNGMTVKFNGYSDALPKLFKTVLGVLRRFDSKEKYRKAMVDQHFDNVKSEILRKRSNIKYDRVYSQVLRDLPAFLHTPSWSNDDIRQALSQIDKATFLREVSTLFKAGRCESLVFGNFNKRQAQRFFSGFSKLVSDTDPKSIVPPLRQVTKLAGDKLHSSWLNVEADDAASVLYVQGRNASLKEQALFHVLEKNIGAPFYHSLRTEQQLGYIVLSGSYDIDNVPGIVLLVQSPKLAAQDLYHKKAAFFHEKKAVVFSNFERDRQALLVEMRRPFTNQQDWANLFWRSITEGDREFSKRNQLIDAVIAVKREEVEALYDKLFIAHKNGILLLTKNDEKQLESAVLGADMIKNYLTFKRKMPSYAY